MKLLIVESPNKIKKLRTFLDNSWNVAASVGHVCDLPENDMAIDLQSGNFEQKYQVSKSKADVVAKLKAQAQKAEAVYLASDPDREGEAISWHLCRLLKLSTDNPNRVCFHSITKEEVTKALKDPRPVDMNLVDAYRTRRAVDRIFGYQLSPEIQRFGMRSAGRCQTPCLNVVVQREEAIQNFKPRKYFSLKAVYKEGITAEYALPDKEGKYKTTKVDTEENMNILLPLLETHREHKVISVNEYTEDKKPRPPFITSTIITDAAAKLKFKPAKTTELLQSLFHKGLITYIRTDSIVISEEGLALAQQVLSASYPDIKADKPVIYNAKKSAQGAHECIRPTHGDDSRELQGNRDELALYTLIRNRFLASQCKPQVFKRQDIVLSAETDPAAFFLARNRIEVFPGFTKIYFDDSQDNKKDGEEEEEVGETFLEISEGSICNADKYITAAQETKPPQRFKLATLSKEIERLGFGRPSTFSAIVQIPLDRGYYEEDKKGFLHPTETGMSCIHLLRKTMPEAIIPDFTKTLEENLDVIAEAGNSYKTFMGSWFAEWTALLQKAKKFFVTVAKENPSLDKRPKEIMAEPCPNCKGAVHLYTGRFGKYTVCSSCDRKQNLEFTVSSEPCPRCKEKMNEHKGKFGKYLKCPKCQLTVGEENLKKLRAASEAGLVCPLCKAPMIERSYKDKNGGGTKTFYGCSRYPECRGTRQAEAVTIKKEGDKK
ncbi:MAG: type I DNA topoisomerase [Fibrobacteres bacterium]|nr:type I DNA topoisomerase [Fibrobacterota bacterium]